jgi:hypothetical protein
MNITIIFLIICSLALAVYVTYLIVNHKPHDKDAHKIHKEPLYVIDGKFMNTHQRGEHLKTKIKENENSNAKSTVSQEI